jgi:hypothetical protein
VPDGWSADLRNSAGVRNGGFAHTSTSFAHGRTPRPKTAPDVWALELNLNCPGQIESFGLAVEVAEDVE